MKPELREKDLVLLKVAFSVLIAVLMIRLAILPSIDACEEGKIRYEEVSAQAEEMQKLIDDMPANETKITEGMNTLRNLSDSCYESMENREIDKLVTGIALSHGLFPSKLSISEHMSGVPAPYLYSPSREGRESEEEDAGQTAAEVTKELDENRTGEDSEEEEPMSAVTKVQASISIQGSESDRRAFLNDIENNYPAIHIKSFEMSENAYMNTSMELVTQAQMNAVLEIYMYENPMIN